MADIEVIQVELDCDCGSCQQLIVDPDNDELVCPDCGRIYEVVAYVLKIGRTYNQIAGR
jgi:Zn finger protein HypA/HybF involved in hydrogenase expression